MTSYTHSAAVSQWLGASAPKALMFSALIALAGISACTKSAPPNAVANPDLAAAPIATLPLSDAPAQNYALAPPIRDLPAHSVRRARLARPHDRYAFVDRANQMNDAFGDAPPDYSFDYQGARPWAWRGDDGYQTVVEHLPGGAERHYYYEPGSDAPFLVRDRDYAYGYEQGALVMVYDHGGNALSPYDVERRADDAGRILYRAQLLFQASRRASHYAVARDDWGRRRSYIDGERAQWVAQRDQNPDWRDYHQQSLQQQPQTLWAQERFRREAEAARIDQANNNAAAAARERQAAIDAAALTQFQNRARADQSQFQERTRIDQLRQRQVQDAAMIAAQDQQRVHDRAVTQAQAQDAARIDQIVRQQATLQQNSALARDAATRQHLQEQQIRLNQQAQQNLLNAQAARRAAQAAAARGQSLAREAAVRQQAQAIAQEAAVRQMRQKAQAAQLAEQMSVARAQGMARETAAHQQAQIVAAQVAARQRVQAEHAAQQAQQLAAVHAQAAAREAAARRQAAISHASVTAQRPAHDPDVSVRLKPRTSSPTTVEPAASDPVAGKEKHPRESMGVPGAAKD